ncbi:hypothetical protein MKZ38_009558 [Zalerion maritima]|uniref:Uncharacterized protein n=1 Tax=Zalerion maritima TaxID=339359 RepID=A0AAD5S1G8_9PEZI|nr:hypothetical protein MKZ38_009558 [Zalerion maritima]
MWTPIEALQELVACNKSSPVTLYEVVALVEHPGNNHVTIMQPEFMREEAIDIELTSDRFSLHRNFILDAMVDTRKKQKHLLNVGVGLGMGLGLPIFIAVLYWVLNKGFKEKWGVQEEKA